MRSIARTRGLFLAGRRGLSSEAEVTIGKPETVSYEELKSKKDISSKIERAFGFEGLGLITVSGIPNLAPLRSRLLPLAHKLANLDEKILAKYEHPKSWYSFGWSRGKEVLEGRPDFAKGSFYANPQHDVVSEKAEEINAYPSYLSPNIWPKAEMPDLQPAFKSLGTLIVDTGILLADHCDAFVSKKSKHVESGKLTRIIRTSRVCKGRLLHYYPIDPSSASKSLSSWCGWHNDHGSLTGLTSALFADKHGKEIPNPDPLSGLYIKTRKGGVVKVNIPADHIAYQIGEASQIHSGGFLQATPHTVRGITKNGEGVSRATLAVFMQPNPTEPMTIPKDRTQGDAEKGSTREFLPEGMPVLGVRFDPKDDFGTFTNKTLKHYH